MDDRKRIMLLDLGRAHHHHRLWPPCASGRDEGEGRQRGVHVDPRAVSCCLSTDGSHTEDAAG